MPEYLSPGVYVEEIQPRFRAIEGVSTSTAAFVGPAERGPVPGFPLPFAAPAGFVLEHDPAPVLVTSFGDYVRQFGSPMPLPLPTDITDNGYMGWAARAFFDNGGRRLYVTRVVGENATHSSGSAQRGTVLRLTRSVRTGATEVALDSLRGVAVGSQLIFRRRSDGSNALAQPSTPAALSGDAAPFNLASGSTLQVTYNNTTTTLPAIEAHPVVATTTGTADFTFNAGDSFDVRVGGSAAPVQTVTFTAADVANGPLSSAELAAILNAQISGVSVTEDGSRVTVTTDVRGNAAELQFLPGGVLAFDQPSQVVSNVDDATQIEIAELQALWGTPDFEFTDNAGNLQLATILTGPGQEITVTGDPGVIAELGFNPTTDTGGAGAAVTFTVVSYDTRRGSIELTPALPDDIDRTEVYVLSPATPSPTLGGPTFHARSPGSWARDVRIEILANDRPPVQLAAPVVASASQLQVRSVSSFYVGAIIELDNGTQREYHEVTGIVGQTLELAGLTAAAADPQVAFVRTMEIDIVVSDESGAAPTEVYRGLSWNRSANANLARHFATPINAQSRLVFVEPGPGTASLDDQPTTPTGFPMRMATIGDDDLPDVGPAGDAVFIGDDNGPGQRTGLAALDDLDRVSIVAAPGRTTTGVQLALIAHCERMRYRVAILDGEREPAAGSISSIIAHRNAYDSSYAAYYAPWIGVTVDGRARYLPPSGYLSGLYARVDNQRGVWKAPANESVFNAVSLRTDFTDGEQDVLNPLGINLIRRFDQRGIRVWGGRTLSSDPAYRYINVRRTLNAIEESIARGTQWVVFEPNAPGTWSRVRDTVRAFLLTWWRDGALFGESPEQAFFVRCDETTMTADDIHNGRLICNVGVSIVRPAEFVIFRIEQTAGLPPA